MAKKTEKVKPCPFCGSSAHLTVNYLDQIYVTCDNALCYASIWADAKGEDGKKEAVERWNRRAT